LEPLIARTSLPAALVRAEIQPQFAKLIVTPPPISNVTTEHTPAPRRRSLTQRARRQVVKISE